MAGLFSSSWLCSGSGEGEDVAVRAAGEQVSLNSDLKLSFPVERNDSAGEKSIMIVVMIKEKGGG